MQGLSPRLALLPDVDRLPPLVALGLAGDAASAAARARKLERRLREVLALLGREGIEALPLKGGALVLRGDLPAALRPMGDLDLLLAKPADVARAAGLLGERLGYRRLLDTPRHLVLAERGERLARPGGEDPENPLRIELHRSFRLPVLGSVLDATPDLLAGVERTPEGFPVPGFAPLLRHLALHAAEDFAAKGLRGVQAADFLVLARRHGPLPVGTLAPEGKCGDGPLLYAFDGIERLFPGTFEAASLSALAARVPAALRRRAASLPVLRHARPERGWTRTSFSLIERPLDKARFALRTLFPTPGEVKANVAPDAEGLVLAAAWLKVLARRLVRLVPGPGSRR